MRCLDASALIDYLEGVEAIGDYIEAHAAEPLFAPTIALHEVFVGAARTRGPAGVDDALADLDWVEPLPLDVDGAAEAARIDAKLHGEGRPIGALDTLIAGMVRAADGELVTADPHFEAVAGLAVSGYERS